ncbi:MAG: AhpC/TSA family protein [Myxococcales bacterium]|nr:AhpC/TSA family protein [Myxococcales bacterium]
MRLEAGTEAPDFEVETVAGERVQLNELRGKPVWLGFSRWASCPMCNYRIHQMIGEWPRRYEKREFRHLNFSPSPPEKLQAYVLKQSPPFDLVSDVEQAQYKQYGLESSLAKGMNLDTFRVTIKSMRMGLPGGIRPDFEGPAFRVPADFLIDREGTIRVAFYGKKITESIPFELVDTFLDQQQA